MELSDAVFGIEPNESVVHDVREEPPGQLPSGHAERADPGEVSCVGRQALAPEGHRPRPSAGYQCASEWTHGGIAFAPKPRDYSYTLNKKVKRLALKTALSAKAAAGEILVVDGMAVEEIKTALRQGVPDARSAPTARLCS